MLLYFVNLTTINKVFFLEKFIKKYYEFQKNIISYIYQT